MDDLHTLSFPNSHLKSSLTQDLAQFMFVVVGEQQMKGEEKGL
jgi:hypothetical protein